MPEHLIIEFQPTINKKYVIKKLYFYYEAIHKQYQHGKSKVFVNYNNGIVFDSRVKREMV